jgi:hypothetical protein
MAAIRNHAERKGRLSRLPRRLLVSVGVIIGAAGFFCDGPQLLRPKGCMLVASLGYRSEGVHDGANSQLFLMGGQRI